MKAGRWNTYSGSPGWLYAMLELETGGVVKVVGPTDVTRRLMVALEPVVGEVERAAEAPQETVQ